MKLSLAAATVALVAFSSFAPAAASVGCAARSSPAAPIPAAPIPAGPASEHDRAVELTSARADEASDRRATKEVIERLEAFGAVSDGPRGMVVSLAGSVLFEGDTARLMPSAEDRLDRIALALREVDARSIAVEGHVDRSDDDERDLARSRQRAAAVRSYLVSRGVDANRLRAEGFGSTAPVTSSASTQDRDENRRVEIVIEAAGTDGARR